ncbi:MAG: hypothetical protein U0X20_32935 [Caldilineaceae bacterium]
MTRRTILRLARPTTLPVILDSLVSRTNTKQGADHFQVTTLKPVVAEETDLPVFAEAPPDGQVGFIYCAGLCPYMPPGEPPLIVCFRPLPGHGCEQDGVFSGAIVVYAWQHPLYPLSPKEVEWSIASDCGCEDHEWLDFSLCWQKLNAMAHDNLHDLVAEYEAKVGAPDCAPTETVNQGPAAGEANATSHTEQKPIDHRKRSRSTDPSRRGTRQARKVETRFLMNNMRSLDNVYDFEHLYLPYCHVYEDSEGHLPSNPRASFLQAAYSCADRIVRERGLN